MSGKTFAVVFSGKLVEGASAERVKQNVAALFKVEVAKVERLFSGARVAIKKGVDEATAKKYQMALHKAGAVCAVVDTAKASKRVQAASGTRQKPAAAQAGAAAQTAPQPAPTGTGLTKSVVKPAPGSFGELGNAHLDEPGVVLVEHVAVVPPQIDTGELSMDQPGAVLTEHEVAPEPAVDISGISMAEVGAEIGKAAEQKPLEVDTSGFSMDEPGVILVEGKEEPEPEIDTSKLSVE